MSESPRNDAMVQLEVLAQQAFDAWIENRFGQGAAARKNMEALDIAIATMKNSARAINILQTIECVESGAKGRIQDAISVLLGEEPDKDE